MLADAAPAGFENRFLAGPNLIKGQKPAARASGFKSAAFGNRKEGPGDIKLIAARADRFDIDPDRPAWRNSDQRERSRMGNLELRPAAGEHAMAGGR